MISLSKLYRQYFQILTTLKKEFLCSFCLVFQFHLNLQVSFFLVFTRFKCARSDGCSDFFTIFYLSTLLMTPSLAFLRSITRTALVRVLRTIQLSQRQVLRALFHSGKQFSITLCQFYQQKLVSNVRAATLQSFHKHFTVIRMSSSSKFLFNLFFLQLYALVFHIVHVLQPFIQFKSLFSTQLSDQSLLQSILI